LSTTVDSRIVQAQFDNKEFEKHIRESIDSLNDFEKSLNMKGASSGLDEVSKSIKDLAEDVGFLANRFSIAGELVHDFWYNIANKAISLVTGNMKKAKDMLVGMSDLGQYEAGLTKYSQKLSSVKTIMNNTGDSVDAVNGYLDELMWYSDETSYGFTDMTSALASMTSAGGDVKKLIPMIEGIANATAFAGKGAAEFSRTIYNLNQSYGAGSLQLMDWKSVNMAGVGSMQLKQTLIDAGKALGTLNKKSNVTIGNFESTLKDKWATKEVMELAFGQFASFTQGVKAAVDGDLQSLIAYYDKLDDLPENVNRAFGEAVGELKFNDVVGMYKSLDKVPETVKKAFEDTDTIVIDSVSTLAKLFGGVEKIPEQFSEKFRDAYDTASEAMAVLRADFDDTAVKAFESAQQCKTFTDVIEAIKDAVSSSWMRSIELIKGDVDSATEMWTDFYDVLYSIISPLTEFREALIETWADLGGRDILLTALSRAWQNLGRVMDAVKQALHDVFPESNNRLLIDLTQNLNMLMHNLNPTQSTLDSIYVIVYNLATLLKSTWSIVKGLYKILKPLLSTVGKIAKVLLDVTASISDLLGQLLQTGDALSFIVGLVDVLKVTLMVLAGIVGGVVIGIVTLLAQLSQLPIIQTVLDVLMVGFQTVGAIAGGIIVGIISAFSALMDLIETFKTKGFVGVFSDITNGIKDIWYALTGQSTTMSAEGGIIKELGSLEESGEKATGFISYLKTMLSDLVTNITIVWNLTSSFREKFQPMITAITDIYDNLKWGEIVGLSFAVCIIGIANSLNTLVKSLSKLADGISGITKAVSIFDFINNLKKNITKLNKTLEKEVWFNGIVKLSAAIMLLTMSLAAIAAIAFIAPGQLVAAMVCVALLIAFVGIVSYFVSVMKAKLPDSNYGGLGVGLIGVASLIATLSVIIAIIQNIVKNMGGASATGIITLGLIAMGAILAEIAAFIWFITKKAGTLSVGNILAFTVLSIAIGVLGLVATSMIAVAGLLGDASVILNVGIAIASLCAALSMIIKATQNMSIKGFGYTISIITALTVMCGVITTFGSMASIDAFEKARDVLTTLILVLGTLQLLEIYMPAMSSGMMENLAKMAALMSASMLSLAGAIFIIVETVSRHTLEEVVAGIALLISVTVAMVGALYKLNGILRTSTPAIAGLMSNTVKLSVGMALIGACLFALASIATMSHGSMVAIVGMMMGLIPFLALYTTVMAILARMQVTGRELDGVAAIGIGVAGIAAACWILKDIEGWDAIGKTAAVMAGLAVTFGILTRVMNGRQFHPDGMLKTAASVMILALAVDVLIPAVAVFALFDPTKILSAAAAVGIVLTTMAVALNYMGKSNVTTGKLWGVVGVITTAGIILATITAIFSSGDAQHALLAGGGLAAATVAMGVFFWSLSEYVFKPLVALKKVKTASGILAALSLFMISLGGMFALIAISIGNNEWAATGVIAAAVAIPFVLNAVAKIIASISAMPTNMRWSAIFKMLTAMLGTLGILSAFIGSLQFTLLPLITGMPNDLGKAGVALGAVGALLWMAGKMLDKTKTLTAAQAKNSWEAMKNMLLFLAGVSGITTILIYNSTDDWLKAVIAVGSVVILIGALVGLQETTKKLTAAQVKNSGSAMWNLAWFLAGVSIVVGALLTLTNVSLEQATITGVALVAIVGIFAGMQFAIANSGLTPAKIKKSGMIMSIIAGFLAVTAIVVGSLINTVRVDWQQALTTCGALVGVVAALSLITWGLSVIPIGKMVSASVGLASIAVFLLILKESVIPVVESMKDIDPNQLLAIGECLGIIIAAVGAIGALLMAIGNTGPAAILASVVIVSLSFMIKSLGESLAISLPYITTFIQTLNNLPDIGSLALGIIYLAGAFAALGVACVILGPGASLGAIGILALTGAASIAIPVLNGMAAAMTEAATAWMYLNQARQGATQIADVYAEIGQWIPKSLANGMYENLNYLSDAGTTMAQMVEDATREGLDVHSESPKYNGIGSWVPISMGNGMLEMMGVPKQAANMITGVIDKSMSEGSKSTGQKSAGILMTSFKEYMVKNHSDLANAVMKAIGSAADKAADKLHEMGFTTLSNMARKGAITVSGFIADMKEIETGTARVITGDLEERIYSEEEIEAWRHKNDTIDDLIKNATSGMDGVGKSAKGASTKTDKLLKITDYAADVIKHFKESYMALDSTLTDSTAYEQAKINVQALADRIFELTATEDELKLTGDDRLEAVKESFQDFRSSVENAVGGSINMLEKFDRSYEQTLEKMNKNAKTNVDATAKYMSDMDFAKTFVPEDTFKYFVEAGVEGIDELEAYLLGTNAEQEWFDKNVPVQKKAVKERELLLLEMADFNRQVNAGTLTDEEKVLKQKEIAEQKHTLKVKTQIEKQKSLYDELAESISASMKSLDNIFGEFDEWTDKTTDNIKDNIKSQMNLFEAFKDTADLSAQELLDNMKSQIDGVNEWAANMQELGNRGLTDGLMQQLADMGPEGYEYVKAFLAMTDEELKSANSMFANSKSVQNNAATTVSNSFVHQFEKNLEDEMDKAYEKTEEYLDNIAELLEEWGPETFKKAWDAGLLNDKDQVEFFTKHKEEIQEKIEDTLALSEEAKNRIANSYSDPASVAAQNLENSAIKSAITDNLNGNIDDIMNAIKEGTIDYTKVGSAILDGIANGVITETTTASTETTSTTTVSGSVNNVLTNTIDVANTLVSDQDKGTYTIGWNIDQGIINGILAGKSGVVDAMIEVVQAAIDAAEEELDINSPSKVMEKIGAYSSEGLAIGVSRKSGAIIDSVTNTTDNMIDFIKSAMSTVGSILSGDSMTDFTITPLIDLSDAEEKSAILRSMFTGGMDYGTNTTANLAYRANAIRVQAQAPIEVTPTSANAGNSFNFTQNNYSPKALSRIEIYRQTRNQFSRMRDAVEGA